MTKQLINLNQIPDQSANFTVKNKNGELLNCSVIIRTVQAEIIIDLKINDVYVCRSRRIIDRMPLILNNNYGGNFYFADIFGGDDPDSTGFNDRFQFIFDPDFSV